MHNLDVQTMPLIGGTEATLVNVAATSATVTGTAGTLGATAPAGADDVSLLASAESTALAADFLASSVVDHEVVAAFATALSACSAVFVAADNAVK